jgi:hypothetical protein
MVFACGLATDVHYCMGKKVGTEFFANDNKQCGKCGMSEDSTGCCHDEHQFKKIEDSHNTAKSDVNLTQTNLLVQNTFSTIEANFHLEVISIVLKNFSQPADTGPRACILNCVFLI